MHRNTVLAAAAASLQQEDVASLSTIVDSQMTWPARTHGAGTLRESDAGKEITVCGWVDRNRNMGGLCFLDVRDHTGLLQVRMQHSVYWATGCSSCSSNQTGAM